MTVKDWLKKTVKERIYIDGTGIVYKVQDIRPRLYCNDGFSVSVQASEFNYCEPRRDGVRNYKSVELRVPSVEDELIRDYSEDDFDDPDYPDIVYKYVPIEIVEKLIEKHGGIIT